MSESVISEPRVYALDSSHSYFGDAATLALDPNGVDGQEARSRMDRYAVELAHEIESRSAEGQRAERIVREHARVDNPTEHRDRTESWMREIRALGSGGGITSAAASQFAAFVSPYFLLSEWATWRGIYRTFADQCYNLPIPPWGMQIYVPYFSSADATTQQTEGGSITELDPSTALQVGPVTTQAGQITLSQQVRDRAFRGGGSIDAVISNDLRQRLDEKIDVYALTQTIAAAGSVAGAASSTIDTFYNDLAVAREAITDTPGVRLRPTHLFTTYDLYSFISKKVDLNDRPYFQPQFIPDMRFATGADNDRNGGPGAPKWARFTGSVLPGSLLWFTDDNIPASGANTQVIVSAPDQSVILLESPEPILSAFPQTLGNQLQVVLNLRSYVSVVTKRASGTQVVTGAAYATANK